MMLEIKGLKEQLYATIILEIRLPQNPAKVDLVICDLHVTQKFQDWCSKSGLKVKPIHIVQVIL